jgi:hypothetical protein
VKASDDEYEVLDGQQRLLAVYEFFSNELPLSPESSAEFGGTYYKDLPQRVSDAFDDFEIEYDEIEESTEEELKDFFQRLQAGLPLTSSEKLNAVHSKLRDFCRNIAEHAFFQSKVVVPNTRYAHFDIVAKAVTAEVEGLGAGMRFDDLKEVFQAQANFSRKSAIAKRIVSALDFLNVAFPNKSGFLRSRTVIQSLITLTCKVVATGKAIGLEGELRTFFEKFASELSHQVELGQAATDSDYLKFQRSINANVKTGAQTRHEVLLRRLFASAPKLAEVFDPTVFAESGTTQRVRELGQAVGELVHSANQLYATKHGEDLFKPTNNTARALNHIGISIGDLNGYRDFIDDLYFLFRESVGERLNGNWPSSFSDVNLLRTDLRHDVDHGQATKVKSKRKKIGNTFVKYAGIGTPGTFEPARFVLVQANLLTAIEADLKMLATKVV